MGLVHRDSVEMLERELRDALNVKAAAKRLGVGRHGVLDLIHGGLLPRTVRTAKGWLIPRASVAELENFCQRLPEGKSRHFRWLSLRQATRLFGPTGLTLALLIELVRDRDGRGPHGRSAKASQRDRRFPCGSHGQSAGDTQPPRSSSTAIRSIISAKSSFPGGLSSRACSRNGLLRNC